MSHAKNDSGRYPLCKALVAGYKVMARDEARTATADERIASVWPFLIAKASAFMDSLKDGQRANYDLEDVLTELYVELRKKDEKFQPDVANYITYSGTLADHLFVSIRDLSRTVHSPKNSGCRMAGYEKSRREGTITGRRAATAGKIRRTRLDFGDLEGERLAAAARPDQEAEDAESRRLAVDAVMRGIASLSPYEAAVIGAQFGLWGQDVKSNEELVENFKGNHDDVNSASRSAKGKIRQILESSGHTYCQTSE